MATLIVADDDDDVRTMLRYALIRGGHTVIEAVDGQDAWEKLQKNGADGLVLDVNMPRMDGLALCRKVRSSSRFADTPILMLTIRALAEDHVHGFDSGADEYLIKPFEPGLLLSRVRALLTRVKNRP